MRFEVFVGANRQWYWRVRSRNGQICAQSEGYTKRGSAFRAARRFYDSCRARLAEVVEVRA